MNVFETKLGEEIKALKAENEKLKQAITDISNCHFISTGNEPSLSCFNRALDEALALTSK